MRGMGETTMEALSHAGQCSAVKDVECSTVRYSTCATQRPEKCIVSRVSCDCRVSMPSPTVQYVAPAAR